ncbi:MAG: hypothetical protein JXB04_07835 [Kiritimatiellae bacterium]|nr:hypothetical protein [Kiritimatiellia bacterium]
MHRSPVSLALAIALSASAASAEPAADADVPVAPIAAAAFEGWTNAFQLANPLLEVTVAPCVGRIVRLRFKGGDNLLRLDGGLKGRVPDPAHPEAWPNYGGDWLWPVAQSRWTAMAGADWPPPPPLAEAPWTGTAWKDADGAQCCLLAREYGEPVNLKVTRLVKLDKEKARVSIRQRAERTATSDVPVVLWHISQVGGATRVVLPRDTDSAFSGGLKPLLFDLPDAEALSACDEAVVYDTSAGEHKLCSDSKRAWIAAEKNGTLLLESASNGSDGEHPDGGCTVEMYANAGMGYAEIETLSVEAALPPGEGLQNTLVIECHEVPADLSPCDLARRVRELRGEVEPVPAEPAEP